MSDIISSDSLEFLEQVKKGKPRKFVMICKGTEIVSLVVYKKGTVDKYKKEAKKTGKGTFYHGVVDGKGPNINFKLARADGYEKQPTRSQVLKKFLAENTTFKFKPIFEIVETPQFVLDEEDPLVQRFLALQPRILEACEKSEEAANYFNQLCQEVGEALDADDSQAAEMKILAIEKALNRVLGDSEPQEISPEEAKWNEARAQLEPSLNRCLQENLGDTGKMRAVFDYALGKAEAKDFKAALKSLTPLAELVRAALSAGDKETDVMPAGKLEIRRARLQAAQGVDALEKTLRATGHERAIEIADIVKTLTANFPEHLETLLDGLDKAVKSNNTDAVNKIKAGAKKATADWVAYLNKHAKEIEGCEKNPWDIPVAINQPIRASLKSILENTLA